MSVPRVERGRSILAHAVRCALQGAAGISGMLAAVLPAQLHAQERGEAAKDTQRETVVIESSRVIDYAEETSSLRKLTQPLRDTPQAVTTVTRQEIDQRAVASMSDALRGVPGISLGAGETSWQGTNLFLRGFATRNDMFSDGMRDYGYYYRDPFNDSGIEVLKGPASILFGRGSTGGVIQQVSKSPFLGRHVSASLQVGSDDTRRATFDMGTPLPRLSETAAVRFNGMVHEGEVAKRDGAESHRWGVAPSLALGIGTPTRLRASYLHQSDDSRPDYGLPWLAGRPAPVKRSNFYGFESDYLDTDVDVATVRIEHDINPSLTLSNQIRHSSARRRFRISEPVIPAGTSPGAAPETVNVSRNVFEGYSTDRFTQNQTDLTSKFSSGGLGHTLVTGLEVGREEPNPVYITNVDPPTTNLANPQPQSYSVAQSYKRLAAHTRADTLGLYVLDTIRISERWQAMLGARWDRFKSNYRSTGYAPDGAEASFTDVSQTDAALSYRAALIYKPIDETTVYVSFGNSFNPSAEGIESMVSSGRAVAQANLDLDPEKSRTYELGAKWELPGGSALLSGSVFRIEKTNARVPDPLVPGFNSLDGEQRVDGVELELVGELARNWYVRAGYSYLDSEVTRSSPGGPLPGAPLTIAPRSAASLWSQFRLLPALDAGIGVVSISSRLAQNTPAAYLVAPAFTTVDAMLKYRVTSKLAVQANVSNLTDRYYFDQLHPFHVIPGAGRTGMLTLHMDF